MYNIYKKPGYIKILNLFKHKLNIQIYNLFFKF